MQYTDEELIEAIRAGGSRQEQGIRRLYEQFFYLAKAGRSKYRALDGSDLVTAYNSAVISLRKQLISGAFRGDSSLTTYLTRIFTNKCIDELRKRKSLRPETGVEYFPEVEDQTPDALSRLIQSDQVERVQRYLQAIGEVCKQILLDAEYYGYSSEEIAQRIGFSNAASVNSKKYTCLQKLREYLSNPAD
ncbi:MAG: sigma-70 family RNA polymerase sigma factor [Saprospirales bacterium]|nr:sigma-70 family RNA polymerase sigma factor [Saprospirales bacterium]MBK8923338.1 sigma-70 family RNA polymerase sigma factor [Saprospirales bacterium]